MKILDVNKEKFTKMYQQKSYREIQKQTGYSPNTISKIAKKLGLSKKPGRRPDEIIFS